MTEVHTKYLLEQQIGDVKAAQRTKDESGSFLSAHRKWLSFFIDDKIQFYYFSCNIFRENKVVVLIDSTRKLGISREK